MPNSGNAKVEELQNRCEALADWLESINFNLEPEEVDLCSFIVAKVLARSNIPTLISMEGLFNLTTLCYGAGYRKGVEVENLRHIEEVEPR
jgi:hypothetical protein